MNTCAAIHRRPESADAALIAVLYGAGLRRSESVGLDLADYNVEDRRTGDPRAKVVKIVLDMPPTFRRCAEGLAGCSWRYPGRSSATSTKWQNPIRRLTDQACPPRFEKARSPSGRGVVFTAHLRLVYHRTTRCWCGHFDGANNWQAIPTCRPQPVTTGVAKL